MEFFSHIGINIGATVGLHPDAINSTITCTNFDTHAYTDSNTNITT